MSDATLRLLPDFVGGAMVMGQPVGFVGILVGVEIFVGMLGGEFAGFADGAVRPVAGIGVDDGCAVAMQYLFAFTGNIFRHAEGDGETFGGARSMA